MGPSSTGPAVALTAMETPPSGAEGEPGGPPPGLPSPDPDPLREALAEVPDEVRRLVDAGASSPEDLRVLAAAIREQREREATVWAKEVKPGLVKARKASFNLSNLRSGAIESDGSQRRFLLVAGGVALVALALLLVAQLSLLVLVIPVVALLGYAWWLGMHPPVEPAEPDADDAPTA